MRLKKKEEHEALPKTSLARFYAIDRDIAAGTYPSSSSLAERCKTSSAAINRDIAFMKETLGVPIEYDAQKRGYYYSKKTYRLPAGFASANDMLAYSLSKRLRSLCQGTPMSEAACQLFDSVSAPLDGGNTAWYENRINIPEIPHASIDDAVWNAVMAGLRENRVLDFSCPQELKPAFEERHVRPYELFFDMGGWRLSGYDIDRKAVFSFTLSRIKNVRVTDVRFSLPKEYESSKKNNDMYFGVYTGEKKQKYRIAFYNAAAKWVRERHWASDQKIRDIKNGIIIEFTCSQPWKVLQWLFSHGASAHPLAPVELVEEWRRQIKGLWKLFCAP